MKRMITKITTFAILLTYNLHLLPAAKSQLMDDVVVSINLKLKKEQEQLKVDTEKISQACKKAKDIIINQIIRLIPLKEASEYRILELEKLIHEINDGDLRTAWDILILYDNCGNNIDELDILLKSGRINIEQRISNSDPESQDQEIKSSTPLGWSIFKLNYQLFEFLIKNGAKLDQKIFERLKRNFCLCLELHKENKAEIFRKMLFLYLSYSTYA